MIENLQVSDEANSDPTKWNSEAITMYWGHKTKNKLVPLQSSEPVNQSDAFWVFYQFLFQRRNPSGQPLTKMFGVPQAFPDQ